MDDSQKLIQQQFGAHAQDYATSAVHAQGASLARLVGLTQPQRDWLVLDVSTGAGHTALTFAPHVALVTATDLTPQMLTTALQLANERGITNVEFRPADAHALPFVDNAFDLVTNRLALHHYSDARKAIAEMARVCKTGGIVALTDNIVPPDKVTAGFINHFENMRDPSHNWCYPLVRLEAMFADAGLQVMHSESSGREMDFEQWARRMGNNDAQIAELAKRLNDAPDAAREFLKPRTMDGHLTFSLTEAIIIGRKAN